MKKEVEQTDDDAAAEVAESKVKRRRSAKKAASQESVEYELPATPQLAGLIPAWRRVYAHIVRKAGQ